MVNGLRGSRRTSVVLLAVATLGVAIAARADAGAGNVHAGAAITVQAAPFWCQWVPPQWWPPECRSAPPTTTPSATTAPPTSTSAPGSTTTTLPGAGGGVEARFASAGPWTVTTASASDAAGAYTLFYPSQLGAGGARHPILTWGNGTGSAPSNYDFTLRHLASWGFVVVASNSGQTGWGNEMLAGADHLVSQNGSASSIFHDKLDTTAIGAFGHSQGATGAVNATNLSNGRIDSIVPINFVDPAWFNPPEQMPDFSDVDAPIFFVSGTSDFLSTASAQQNYYDEVPGAAAKAALAGGGHNNIQQANNALVGYITAWLMYTLGDDDFARRAFVGGELGNDPDWRNQAHKNLP